MKKSQLKETIKNEIKSVLSEDLYENMTPEEIEDFKLQQAAHRLKHTGRTLDDERKASEIKKKINQAVRGGAKREPLEKLADDALSEGTWSSGTYNEIGRFIQDVKNLRDKYYDIVGSDDVFDGLDRAEEAAREMMVNAPENRSDVTFSDIREAKSAADVDKEVKDLESKMKDQVEDFKAAEGKAKDKIKDELKDMTTKRNDLKKKVEDLKKKEEKEAEDIGRGQELDA